MAGQSLSGLRQGIAQTDHLMVADIDGLALLLRHAGPQSQTLRRRMLPRLAYRARLWQGVHDRGEAYVFAGLPLLPDDVRRMHPHFPARVVVHSIPELSLNDGEVLDVTSLPKDWDVGDREEIYVLLNIDRLSLKGTGEVRVSGNTFCLIVQRLHCDGGRIALQPTPHPVDRGQIGGFDGARGADGLCGSDGGSGRSVQALPSVLGPIVTDVPDPADRLGGDGTAGQPGRDGARGRPGGMCKSAEILIRRWADGAGPLRIDARAGDGGHGGAGGAGGNGGRGGPAGRGLQTSDPPIADGDPGRGGPGARGGDGGAAGHSGIGSHIFVECPNPNLIESTVRPGRPGRPGVAGAGGRGGTSDTPDHHGRNGPPGQLGRPGRTRPGPEIFITGT